MTKEQSAGLELKTAAYAVIVDGWFHDVRRFEIDARESGFETRQRFDLLPLTYVINAQAAIEQARAEEREGIAVAMKYQKLSAPYLVR